MERNALSRSVEFARGKLAKSNSVWASCADAGTGFIATAYRLGWSIADAFTLIDDLGNTIDLKVSPPAVLVHEVREAVRRWCWRAIEDKVGQLNAPGTGLVGANMRPIWKLLASKEQSLRWNSNLRGALKSAMANRQWTQARCFQVGWVQHGSCLFCLKYTLQFDGTLGPDDDVTVAIANATAAQTNATPKGTAGHRIWRCPTLATERENIAPQVIARIARTGNSAGKPQFERAFAAFSRRQSRHRTLKPDLSG